MGKKAVKNTNTWRLNNVLLNNQSITEEIREKFLKYIETNDKNKMTPNPWVSAKTVLSRRFIAIKPCLKKQEKSQKII